LGGAQIFRREEGIEINSIVEKAGRKNRLFNFEIGKRIPLKMGVKKPRVEGSFPFLSEKRGSKSLHGSIAGFQKSA